ncbi:MAG: CapA family protein [Dysgonamonadaceae bacterium]|nr:CapA family protein [Dysgonamonadaceae bacterium]MDD3356868.1 CapA family protein [Dysgonamonadaceae bacterium]MDD3728626.1 CapA family protein [Dysgonamonadaceae bacterium]MDD4247483.1 CapA family protein [Dysgonamonadaceae bacterium]
MRNRYLFILLLFSFAKVFAQENRVTLLFAGDAMQHLPQIYATKKDSGYYYDSVFELVKEKISQADIAGVNFETTLGGKPYRGYPTFSSPNEFATALHNAGFDIFFTANNHALDTGKKGLEQTIRVIKELGAKQTGTFESQEKRDLQYPLMIIKNGIRIAFLNYTYGINGLVVEDPNIVNLIDTIVIKEDLETASLLKPDIIIAVMHWGEEYHTKPSIKQKETAQFLVKNGVRIVIGHHPHVVQPVEISSENDNITHATFYSLGNFVSNQRKINTDGGMIAEIVLNKTSDSEGENSLVNIESVDYSFVWVHKYYKVKKPVYRLLPIKCKDIDKEKSMPQSNYNLTPYEQKSLERFVKAANKNAVTPL